MWPSTRQETVLNIFGRFVASVGGATRHSRRREPLTSEGEGHTCRGRLWLSSVAKKLDGNLPFERLKSAESCNLNATLPPEIELGCVADEWFTWNSEQP
tara:strand:- start:9 stop:305 length:297 start_codon:yes stop_codon:yes gene_type:complete